MLHSPVLTTVLRIVKCEPQNHELGSICFDYSIKGKENDDKRIDIAKLVNPKKVKVLDEHHNQPVEWACKQHYRFDNYERGIADLFVGELGIDGKYPYNLLASGAVRMSLERNGDLNPLLAERPVMRHWDFSEHREL